MDHKGRSESVAQLPLLLLCMLVGGRAAAAQIDIPGPAGSVFFGTSVAVLPNGNFVVTDPSGPVSNVGAVYLYSPEGALISSFTGGSPDDHVGDGGIIVLPSGNFLVLSPHCRNGSATNAGAVTWINGSTGLTGAVGADNSLVGSTAEDRVGDFNYGDNGFIGGGVTVLSNGAYVVSSLTWDNGMVADAGAATWGSGTAGVSGEISVTNSLVGTHANDHVGNYVFPLSSGNVVIDNPDWDNGTAGDAGAVTWVSGVNGRVGTVSASNSLVGLKANDHVGGGDFGSGYTEPTITTLSNGNYVVQSSFWDNGSTLNAGAATWVNGTSGLAGIISTINSLVGTQPADFVGGYVLELANGNYLVASISWGSGAGAVTWGSGVAGVKGTVSAGNSLVGSSPGDYAGSTVVALTNGNYVVASSGWSDGGNSHVGAVTWGNGTTGEIGAVSTANSLTGSVPNDQVGSAGVVALKNGNYVVRSPNWDDPSAANAGAVTWRDGSAGSSAVVSSSNSLVGSTLNDQVGDVNSPVVALDNGNYVVASRLWDNGAATEAGAVTWGSGVGGVSGAISPANSLVGTKTNDLVGTTGGVVQLTNGNYVVASPYWDNGGVADAGAATWCDASSGCMGAISSASSLVGTSPNDQIGQSVLKLSNGNYVVISPGWDGAGQANVGAATWGNGNVGVKGNVSGANSLVGAIQGDSIGSVLSLANGNYLVFAPSWDNGSVIDAGAAVWVDGSRGLAGPVTASNSLIGTTSSDLLGNGSVRMQLSDGNYVFNTRYWDNGNVLDAGALTLGNGSKRLIGTVQAWNSVRFGLTGAGAFPVYDYDASRQRLVVGRAAENLVTLFTMDQLFFDNFDS